MNRYVQQIPPRWWEPKLSPFFIRCWKPLRRRKQFREQQLMDVEVRNLDHLQTATEAGQGVLIAPNHSGHADAYIMYEAADQLGAPFYFMTAWQVFQQVNAFGKLMLQHHGCFSIDREGTDLKAFRQAVDVLQEGQYPLVIFPEGEVYHTNDRITPFREGAAAAAISGARKSKQPVLCVPCGIKYQYLNDPTENLLQLMGKLEREIFWRPRTELPLPERIYRFAEGAMALKEVEYLGRTSSGPLSERTTALADHILLGLEQRYECSADEKTIPERVKDLRRHAVVQLSELPEGDAARQSFENDLDDLFLVVQLFSYPGDYVEENPTVERMAETLDKFEEDVLGSYSATIRGPRKAVVSFGEPIEVAPERKSKSAIPDLTQTLEQAVQSELDGLTM